MDRIDLEKYKENEFHHSAGMHFGELDIWLIDRYLKRNGETLEDAKIRIWEQEHK